ncbi:MAG TPA: phosphoribosylglycinamide formyltransferase [Melioribacteraceae bacterium]|nr:phosphoribosylglycinamide formyltransferase [Melioribacteraceae bacterium]
MLKIAVFVSGRGSNLKSVFNKVPKEKLRICAVVSDKQDSAALGFAVDNKIQVYLVSEKIKEGFVDYNFLLNEFKKTSIDLIVLAGFLKKIPDSFVDSFENRIINIHPALLPNYGGKGMYGLNVHKAVFENNETVSGATVHFVDKIYDNGKIISREKIDISDCKNPVEIAERVLKIEHELLPFVVEKFADGKIKIVNEEVSILE